jgi:hypothetical protein
MKIDAVGNVFYIMLYTILLNCLSDLTKNSVLGLLRQCCQTSVKFLRIGLARISFWRKRVSNPFFCIIRSDFAEIRCRCPE